MPRQTDASDKLAGKPRALSRQVEAEIKLEVHRDSKIRMHLQEDHQPNMNLMFYDFNGSSKINKPL